MKKFSFLSILILIFGLCFCVSLASLLSTAILSSSLFQFTSAVSNENSVVYAISLKNSQNKQELQSLSSTLQQQNGAGFIYQNGQTHHLIASLYENINDAELVKSNLKNNGIEADLLSITLSSNKIEGNFTSEEKVVLQNAINSNFKVFKSLYDIVIGLDTGILTQTKAKLECNDVFSNFISIKTNFDTFFSNNKKEDLSKISSSLSSTHEILTTLINENYDTSNQSFSSLIKLSYCKILLKE